MKAQVIFSGLLLFCSFSLNAQIFLRNEYVEVGIHSAASFGSEIPPPLGYHPNGYGLGFVCDFQRDGWDAGTPAFMGDYFVPGSPEEGWSVEWTQEGSETTFHNYGLLFESDAITTSQSKVVLPGMETGLWEGSAGPLRIVQKTTLREGTLYFTIDVLFRNEGPDTLYSLEYLRNLDPDNEIMFTGSYVTENFVRYQPGFNGNSDTALVVAVGPEFRVPVILGAVDSRARVSVGGFHNRDTDEILDHFNMPAEASPETGDVAISLAFRIGDLAPGQCVAFSYFYGLEEIPAGNALGELQTTVLTESACLGDTTTLIAHTYGIGSLMADAYVWDLNNDGIFETQGNPVSHYFPAAGDYTVRVLVSGCDGRQDTIFQRISIGRYPEPDLGNDTIVCGSDLIALTSGDAGQYLWNTGSHDSEITVSATGAYSVTITDPAGCSASDNILVTFPQDLSFSLGPDTLLCAGESWSCQLPGGGLGYTWQGQESGREFTIVSSGTYIASVQGICKTESDTVRLAFLKPPVLNLPDRIEICTGTAMVLQAGPADHGWTYFGNALQNTNELLIQKEGLYIVGAENSCGSDEDVIDVTERLCDIVMPNVFSPNGDGLNEVFLPAGLRKGEWNITIVNRWGRVVFSGDDPSGWNAEKQPAGVYYFIAESVLGLDSKTGFLHLVR